jgi:TfoX/Sxy family transcriptional regulator of competence genes
MAFDEATAERVRAALGRQQGLSERKMFGGLAFLHNGNMCCGVVKDQLMLRLGEQGAAEALARPHTRPMDFTGKAIKTMVYVEPAGIAADRDLRAWVRRAVDFAASLPAKVPQGRRRRGLADASTEC